MPATTGRVFISAVSEELKSFRLEVARVLRSKQIEVRDQEHFSQGPATLLERLRDYIRQCDAVIFLVGQRCGSFPSDQHALALGTIPAFEEYRKVTGQARASYTQWEYFLASHYRKPAYVYVSSEGFEADTRNPEDDQLQKCQQDFRNWVKQGGKHRDPLTTHAKLIEHVLLIPLTAHVGSEPRNYDLPDVWGEQQAYLAEFAGREEYLAHLHHWCTDGAAGGYLLIAGPPGLGKSAVMAQFAHRERSNCLFHLIKDNRNPHRFMCFLLWQAGRLLGRNFGEVDYQGELEDLRNTLTGALKDISEQYGHALMVLDGLDELDPTGARLNEILPPYLPPGVRVVLSARSGTPLIDVLRDRFHSQLREEELPPLSMEDLLSLLKKHLVPAALEALTSADCEALLQHTAGNALVLVKAVRYIVRARERKETIDIVNLPATTEAVFRRDYDEITEKVGGRVGKDAGIKATLFHLLALAPFGLSREDVEGLLRVDHPEVDRAFTHDLVAQVGEFLRFSADGSRFLPYHQGLSDYTRESVLGASKVPRAYLTYCRWIKAQGTRVPVYLLSHYLFFLSRADEIVELNRLLTTGYLQELGQKVGSIDALYCARELARELAATAADSTDGHVRWEALVACAQAYCTLYEGLRANPTSLEGLIERHDIDRLLYALNAQASPLDQGILMLAVTPMLLETGYRQLAEEVWQRGRQLVAAGSELISIEGRGHAIVAMLGTLIRKLESESPSSGTDGRSGVLPPPLDIPPRKRIPLWLRLLTIVNSPKLPSYATATFFSSFGCFVFLEFLSSFEHPTLSLSKIAIGVFAVAGAILLAMAPIRWVNRRLAWRLSHKIDRVMAELARGLDQTVKPARRQRRLKGLLRFSAGLLPLFTAEPWWTILPARLRQFLRRVLRVKPGEPNWTEYLPGWVAEQFRTVSAKPQAAARFILAASAFPLKAADVLVTELRAKQSTEGIAETFRHICRQMHPGTTDALILMLMARLLDERNDVYLLAYLDYDLKWYRKDHRPFVEVFLVGALKDVPAARVGSAVLKALEGNQRSVKMGLGWTGVMAWTGLPPLLSPSRRDAWILLAIATPGYVVWLIWVTMLLGFRLVSALAAGRVHDPYLLWQELRSVDPTRWRQSLAARLKEVDFSWSAIWNHLRVGDISIRARSIVAPIAFRRARETVYAQQLLRGEEDANFASTFTAAAKRRVISILVDARLLSRHSILYVMHDRRLLGEVRKADLPIEPARTPDAKDDTAQLLSVLPMRWGWLHFLLVVAVGAAAMLLWWWALTAIFPQDRSFWLASFEYGAGGAIAIALLLAAAQHCYRWLGRLGHGLRFLQVDPARKALAYQLIIGLIFIFAAGPAIESYFRAAAGASGLLAPTHTEKDQNLLAVPACLIGLVVPALIARWRGAGLFYPTFWQRWRQRVVAISLAVVAVVLLAAWGHNRIAASLADESDHYVRSAGREKSHERKMEELSQAFRFNPANVDAFSARAGAYINARQYWSALSDLDEVIARRPDEPRGPARRCFVRAIVDQLDGALSDCNKALELKKDYPFAWTCRGLVKFKLGRFEDAIADYDLALNAGWDAAEPLYGRGLAKLKMGDISGGKADIAAATEKRATIAEEFIQYGVH
jgi:tetratricopeptide (TPR) repeat protein